MGALEWIIVVGFILVVIEIFITLIAKAGRYVFDLESYEKDKSKEERQSPSFITGVGKIKDKK